MNQENLVVDIYPQDEHKELLGAQDPNAQLQYLQPVDSTNLPFRGGSLSYTLNRFWTEEFRNSQVVDLDPKHHILPLARIKKVMKTDEEVKMISAEAPILFSRACESFIAEISIRAWHHAEESKRRTLQRSDIAVALSKSDQYDFLIDIVPREEAVQPYKRNYHHTAFGGQPAQPIPPQQQQQQQQQQQPPQQQQQQQPPQNYYSVPRNGQEPK